MQYTVDGVPADLSGYTLKTLSVHRLFVLLLVTMMLQVTVTEGFETNETDIQTNEINFGTDLEDCECIPFGECKNSPVLTGHVNGSLFDYRLPGVCGHSTQICCKTSEKTPLTIQVPQPACGTPNNIYFKIDTKHYEAQYGEFPWMMAILELNPQNQSNPTMHCGGSLITPEVVLTAAHCIRNYDVDTLLVRGGEWDLQAKHEFFPAQDRQILKKIVHKDFYGGNAQNNVALIVVKEPFDLTTNIHTICLPNKNMMFKNEKCLSGGWGKHVTADYGQTADILKKIDLSIVSSDQCLKLYKKRMGPHYNLHNSMICAGGEIGKDTCKGDGGGPLTCPITGKINQFHQAGIVSWGINCGTELPGIYTNVALFRDWIDKFMDTEGFDKKFYDPEFIPNK